MIYKQLGWRYDSPTISTQILPEEFPAFCGGLRRYLETPLTDYRELSSWHEQIAKRFYGDIPKCPIGLLGDVMVVFLHEPTFDVAAAKWNRRKERVDLKNTAYLFQVYHEGYAKYAKQFIELNLPHSICLTEGFDFPGGSRFDIPSGRDGFGWADGKRFIEDNFSVAEWLEL